MKIKVMKLRVKMVNEKKVVWHKKKRLWIVGKILNDDIKENDTHCTQSFNYLNLILHPKGYKNKFLG